MNELILLENVNAIELFTGNGVDEFLEKFSLEVKSIVPDVSTNKGRKEIASIAHRVSTSKTFLEEKGKEIVSEWKKRAKEVDANRKKIRDSLDDLKAEIRKPLTDWEDAEKARLHKYVSLITFMNETGALVQTQFMKMELQEMESALKNIENEPVNEDWEIHIADGFRAKDEAVRKIRECITAREKHDSERIELARLREESLREEKRRRDEQLRIEGEERARQALEEQHQAQIRMKEQAEERARQAEERAKQQKEASERRQAEAIIQAENAAKEAERQAKLRVENAVKAEREKVEAEQRRVLEETRKREADKKHRDHINNTIVASLQKNGVDIETAKVVVFIIEEGRIPYLQIVY